VKPKTRCFRLASDISSPSSAFSPAHHRPVRFQPGRAATSLRTLQDGSRASVRDPGEEPILRSRHDKRGWGDGGAAGDFWGRRHGSFGVHLAPG
jgi:hypothetical protein